KKVTAPHESAPLFSLSLRERAGVRGKSTSISARHYLRTHERRGESIQSGFTGSPRLCEPVRLGPNGGERSAIGLAGGHREIRRCGGDLRSGQFADSVARGARRTGWHRLVESHPVPHGRIPRHRRPASGQLPPLPARTGRTTREAEDLSL